MGDAAPIPQTHSVHEDLVQHPNIIPVDTAHRSVSEARGPTPGATMANVPTLPAGTVPVPATATNIPSRPGTVAPAVTPAPASLPNAPASQPPATVWDTNHPTHPVPAATTVANVPTAPAAAAPTVVPAGDGAPAPATMSNIPLEPLPPAGSGSIPANVGTVAPEAPGGTVAAPAPVSSGKGGRKAVRWDSHLPGKDVVGVPSRTRPPQ